MEDFKSSSMDLSSIGMSSEIPNLEGQISLTEQVIPPVSGNMNVENLIKNEESSLNFEKSSIYNSEGTNNVSDKYVLKTAELKNMLKIAYAAITNEQFLQVTSVIQLVFTDAGLKVLSTDGLHTIEQIDKSVRFTNEVSVAVSADTICKLVDKLDTETVELKPDLDRRLVIVVSGNNEFILQEIYDNGEGTSINIEPKCAKPTNVVPIKVNFSSLKSIIEKGNQFAFAQAKEKEKYLASLYSAQYLISSNKQTLFAMNNLPELANEVFFIGPKLVNIIKGLNLEQVELYFIKDEKGRNKNIYLESSNIIVSGILDDATIYPVDTLLGLIEKPLENVFTISKSKLVSVIDRAKIFVNSISDKNCCKFALRVGNPAVEITDYTGKVYQSVALKGVPKQDVEFNIDITAISKALGNFGSDEIQMLVGNDIESTPFLKLCADGITEILLMQDLA